MEGMKYESSFEPNMSGIRGGLSKKLSKKKPTSLRPETVEYLKSWMMSPEHVAHPYPTEQEKAEIMAETGIELKQLTNWFVNNRKRFWKPRVEAGLREQNHCAPGLYSPGKTTGTPSLFGNDLSLRDLVSSIAVQLLPPTEGAEDILGSSTVSRINSLSSVPSLVACSPQHLISDHSSCENESGNFSSDESNAEEGAGQTTQEEVVVVTETIHVHILRSTSGTSTPSIQDVSIQSTVPSARVLKTFENVALTYQSVDFDSALSSRRTREAEVLRIKKQYLNLYMVESMGGIPTKRTPEDEPVTPRPKFRRVSVDLWKEACLTALNGYDSALPTLEEATTLFGFSP